MNDLATSASPFTRLRPLVRLASIYLVCGALLRIVLWVAFARHSGVSAATLGATLAGGALNDAVAALYLLAPLALFLCLWTDRALERPVVRASQGLLIFGFLFFVGFQAVAEFYFFEEFDSRFNVVAVDYLLYPTEVVGDIRAEYPLWPALIGVAILAACLVWANDHRLVPRPAGRTHGWGRAGALASYVCAIVAVAMLIDTDSLALSHNRVTNELVANGTSSFVRAVRTSEIDYTAHYASRDSATNLALLRAQLAEGPGTFIHAASGLDRHVPADPNGLGRLNVVVIVSESFGSEFSRAFGGEHDWTPVLDELAGHSLAFTNMYASGTRTVRGLEAITASLPPIPTTSILHRPGNDGIANWGTVMRGLGYQTSFLYGGYGQFDDMDAFYEGNGFEVHDRRDIEGPVRFANIWGVSDEDLYDMALRRFDQAAAKGPPFFSIVMNTSNHKPFTFREGVPGVKMKGGGRESGVRYADFAQGYFLREAAKHAWFDDTLFIIVADHGARVYGREDIPLKTYRIPMILYSPKHIRPGRIDTLTTQIDVAPTVLGILGLPYSAPFFGQDVRHVSPRDRVAFFSHNNNVAVYRNGELAILGLHRSIRNVGYDAATDRYHELPRDPALEDLGIAYYQTAYELFRSRQYLPDTLPLHVASARRPAP